MFAFIHPAFLVGTTLVVGSARVLKVVWKPALVWLIARP